jgi:hypothetical protein
VNKIDYSKHVTILAWINIALSAIIILFAVFALLFLSGMGVAAGDPKAAGILGMVGLFGATFLIVIALPGLVAGYGLIQQRRWGRILGIVVSVLNLFEFPIGTLVGLYGLRVLTDDEAVAYFGELRPSAAG